MWNFTCRIGLELCEYRTVDDEHSAMRQENDRRRCNHRLIAAAESRIRFGVLQTTATMSSAQGPAERRAPAAISEDEAENGEHHQEGSHPLTLLSGREGRPAGDAYADAESTVAAHFAWLN